jgi:alanine racemase
VDVTEEEKSVDRHLENFFKVTTHIEYCKSIREETLFIACAQNNDQLASLFRDPLCEYRWLLSPEDQQKPEKDFRLVRFAVDGQTIPPLHSVYTERGYEVWCGGDALKEKVNKNTKIEFELVSKKPKRSNTFSIYLAYPTQGMNISFDYSQANIRNVREVAFFAGKTPHPKRIHEKGKSVALQIDNQEWIFPNSGVTFIWNLEKSP